MGTRKTASPAPAAQETATAAPADKTTTQTQNEELATGVATVPKSSNAVQSLADVQNLMMEDADEDLGFEKEDVALPFLRILQSNSPQVKRQNAKYVDGAEAGMFYNTATGKIYDGIKGITAIPVHFQREATLWIPRTPDAKAGTQGGGGFVRSISMVEAKELLPRCTKNEKKKDITPKDYNAPDGSSNAGLELVIAAVYYMLIVDKDNVGVFEQVAYPMTSTQLKKARAWNAMVTNARIKGPHGLFRPAMFGMAYTLSTVPESNTSGEWMGVKIVPDTPLIEYVDGAPVEKFPGAGQYYLAARDLKELVGKGKVTTKGDFDDTDTGVAGEGDKDLPF